MEAVLFDRKSTIVNGIRELIISGAVHYPRSTPAMWPEIIRESRKAGLNTIVVLEEEGALPENARLVRRQ